MKLPEMILFDYGQTLITEQKFDGLKGTEAVLQYAIKNKYHLSAEQVQAKADEINRETGRFHPDKSRLLQIEIPNIMFTPYLYESLGIEIALSNAEIDTVFWNAASPGTPTEGIKDFLEYLKNRGIHGFSCHPASNLLKNPAENRPIRHTAIPVGISTR